MSQFETSGLVPMRYINQSGAVLRDRYLRVGAKTDDKLRSVRVCCTLRNGSEESAPD